MKHSWSEFAFGTSMLSVQRLILFALFEHLCDPINPMKKVAVFETPFYYIHVD